MTVRKGLCVCMGGDVRIDVVQQRCGAVCIGRQGAVRIRMHAYALYLNSRIVLHFPQTRECICRVLQYPFRACA
eukprot:2749267-Pleurochrysis_carterae.AAC.1